MFIPRSVFIKYRKVFGSKRHLFLFFLSETILALLDPIDYQSSGSVTIGTDPASVSDPALFVRDLQDAKKIYVCLLITYFLKVPTCTILHSLMIKSH
jgi:hypothetical protein